MFLITQKGIMREIFKIKGQKTQVGREVKS